MSLPIRTVLFYSFAIFTLSADVSTAEYHFQAGIEAYEGGDYEIAKSELTLALNINETAAARHNLALTELQLDRPAEAVWQLERALLLDPFHQDYREKRNLVRKQLGLPEKTAKWYHWFSQAFSVNVWLIVATVSFWLLVTALILPALNKVNASHWIKLLCFFGGLTCALSLTAIRFSLMNLKTGIVLSEETTALHAAPAAAAPESGFARPGEHARILDQYNNFYQIETEGSATGWISKDAFRPLAN